MIIALLVMVAWTVGFMCGRYGKFTARVEHEFQEWRDRVTRSALIPRD